MRGWGITLVVVGGIALLLALNMNTSVSTAVGSVQNIGLVADRPNYLLMAGLAILIGSLMAIFGGTKQVMQAISQPAVAAPLVSNEPPCERDLNLDGYRLWLASKYEITRNDVFDRFVMGDQTFDTLDAALAMAHEGEENLLRERAELERQRAEREERLRIEAEEQAEIAAEINRRSDKMIKWWLGGLCALFVVGTPFVWNQLQENQRIEKDHANAERKRGEEALSRWGLKFPDGWEVSEIKSVRTEDGEIWCDNKAGTLVTVQTVDKNDTVIGALDGQLGKGTDPFESVPDDSTVQSESRVYTQKGGKELRVYASSPTVWICDTSKNQ